MFLKAIDFVVFVTMLLICVYFYSSNFIIFELISLAAVGYIFIRRSDLNTRSLSVLLLIANLTGGVFIYLGKPNGYMLYSIALVINAIAALAVWMRSFLLIKYGPNYFKQRAEYLNPNSQDSIMGMLFGIQVIWQLCQLIEHVIRHRDDIGLSGILDKWSPMFFYNIYKEGQFIFSVLMLFVLYFMTFDQSKKLFS